MRTCLCCQDELQEKAIPWIDWHEHNKDQAKLMLKALPAFVFVSSAVAVFNYIVWKRK